MGTFAESPCILLVQYIFNDHICVILAIRTATQTKCGRLEINELIVSNFICGSKSETYCILSYILYHIYNKNASSYNGNNSIDFRSLNSLDFNSMIDDGIEHRKIIYQIHIQKRKNKPKICNV